MKSVWLYVLALVVLVPFGCSRPYHGKAFSMEKGLEDAKAILAKHVKDPDKANQAQVILGDIVAEVKHLREENGRLHRQLYELNARYEAAPEDFTKVLDELNNARMRSASKILGMRFKMKELMTAEEWKAVNDALSEYRGRYQRRDAGKSGSGGS
ncbi:hypothetical protein [Nitrospira sp. Kam-Ns4a]